NVGISSTWVFSGIGCHLQLSRILARILANPVTSEFLRIPLHSPPSPTLPEFLRIRLLRNSYEFRYPVKPPILAGRAAPVAVIRGITTVEAVKPPILAGRAAPSADRPTGGPL